MKTTKQPAQKVNKSNFSASRTAAKKKNNALKSKNATFINGIKRMEDAELNNVILTFHYADESIRKVNCNKLGFYDAYGKKRLTVGQIYSNIVAMQNDLQALYFEIG